MQEFRRITGVFLGGFCFAAALGASSDAHGVSIQEKYAGAFCTPINSGEASSFVFNTNGVFNTHQVDDLTVTCPVKTEHNRAITWARVNGWQNDGNPKHASARWCFADELSTTTGCGPLKASSGLVGNYFMNIDVSVSDPMDYNFLSVTIPGGPNAGSSSLRGYIVGVAEPI
jgi:hypothetical protein